jgi:hypothetical protein
LLQAHPERAPGFRPEDLAGVAVPATLNEIVWERLGPFMDDAREALTVGAVIGRRFRFDVLAGALQWREERLQSVIEQLVAHRLIVESEEDRDELYCFRHRLVQEALSLVMLGWLAVHAGEVTTGAARLELARALLDEQELPVERGAEVFHAGVRALDAAREHQRARAWVHAALEYARVHGARGDLPFTALMRRQCSGERANGRAPRASRRRR